MRRLIYRTAASTELRRIARYTKREWGEKQARRYTERLRQRIMALRRYPLRYPEVAERAGIREMRCGQHLVFYRVSDEAIEIVNIVHVARDWEALV
ncbi:type II toxin-antitoxin system RelE/ParE family toxin [Erythrobacter sp.]|uniref:type II toxin-antitoxin system RelE/ParE family toxin n=1 Tax=Erythrobacter sp. TaxID=1042 RepID=UPI001B19CE23|nr:type II toxin-antitoxin system RelE/ParE family toxin [Erythrobacter sp.]MBO6526217.1 type II toxin-antitoxin system RelE/ParE family toxin [Erythrobacter sp.]MBO6530470.1 type II toxin-antitoxin system RelE/ParE family toxin [Erythrobacter sp.]